MVPRREESGPFARGSLARVRLERLQSVTAAEDIYMCGGCLAVAAVADRADERPSAADVPPTFIQMTVDPGMRESDECAHSAARRALERVGSSVQELPRRNLWICAIDFATCVYKFNKKEWRIMEDPGTRSRVFPVPISRGRLAAPAAQAGGKSIQC